MTTVPGQNVPISMGGGPVDPVWYQAIKSALEVATAKLAPFTLLGNPFGVDTPASQITLGTGLSFSGSSLVGTSIDGVGGAITFGHGLSRSGQAVSVDLDRLTNSLGANVALNATASYFDGPKVTAGTGIWLAMGAVSVIDTVAAAFHAKLWDGTTVAASGAAFASVTGLSSLNGWQQVIALSGILINPAGDIRISVRNTTTTSGSIAFNTTGNSKDSTITAIRIG